MKERIRQLRKALGLTQQEFAEKIGSVQNTITGYETGRRVPSNQVVALIAHVFNVNEIWLRTGEGEMFNPNTLNYQSHAKVPTIGDDFKRRFASMLFCLDDNEWAVLEKIAHLLVETKESEQFKQEGV